MAAPGRDGCFRLHRSDRSKCESNGEYFRIQRRVHRREETLYTSGECSNNSSVPRYRSLLLLACVMLASGGTVVSRAASASREPKYSVQVWQNDEGLPQNSVLSMVQTRDGYLWIGTFKGLVRFDGLRFINVTPELSDRVVHLFEDSRHTLWIGTENSGTLTLKDGRLNAPPELTAGGFDRRLRAACEDLSGAVWLYYANGDLWRYATGSRPMAFIAPRDEGSTRTMICQSNGPVWVGTSRHQYAVGTVAENGSFELPIAESYPLARLDALVRAGAAITGVSRIFRCSA